MKVLRILQKSCSFWCASVEGGRITRGQVLLIGTGVLINLTGLLINPIIILKRSLPPYIGAILILFGTGLIMLGLHFGFLKRCLKRLLFKEGNINSRERFA